ncbi:MAG: hypothetical protein U0168_14390 [Nannocystaceae bacterium]|jgi:hypothetical protein
MARPETLIEGGNAVIRVHAHGLVGVTVSIVERASGETRSAVRLPYPSAGYGGHELVVSPRGRYLAMFLFSGQCEVGYELFSLTPQLAHLGGLDYQYGEGDHPVFSPDESSLVMVWEDYFGWASEQAQRGARHGRVIDWGVITVHALPDGPIESRRLHASLPDGWMPEPSSWTSPTALHFVHARELRMRTPWGSEPSLPFPLPVEPSVVVD